MGKVKLLKTISNTVFFGLVLLIAAFVFLSGKQSFFGWRFLVVKSGSMEPTIKTGSLIFVKQQETYQKGDIITYGSLARAEGLITHRIVEEVIKDGNKFFKTKGDFNSVEDSQLVSQTEVVAKHRFTIPYLGFVIGFAKTQHGVVLLLVIPGTLIVYEEIRNIRKRLVDYLQKKKTKQNNQE